VTLLLVALTPFILRKPAQTSRFSHVGPIKGYSFLINLENISVLVPSSSRFYLNNTTILFNPNLSQPTVLHRFSPCTLDTILPNTKSNPFNIGKYFVCTENYGVHLGHGKTFCRKKTRVRCKKNRVSAEPYYSHPTLFFSWQTVLLGSEPSILDKNKAIRGREVSYHHKF
jgi:hypothetical protein